MQYEKKYPITHLKGEHVLLTWERGYYQTKLYYHDRLVAEVQNLGELKRGVKFNDNELGEIELKFSEKPINVDVIINGYHCSNNISHPKNKIKSISTFFYIIGSLSLVFFIASFLSINYTSFSVFLDAFIITLYFVVAFHASKAKIWAVYTGFFLYLSMTFLVLFGLFLEVLNGNGIVAFFSILGLLVRITLIILMLPYLKYASSLNKHLQFL